MDNKNSLFVVHFMDETGDIWSAIPTDSLTKAGKIILEHHREGKNWRADVVNKAGESCYERAFAALEMEALAERDWRERLLLRLRCFHERVAERNHHPIPVDFGYENYLNSKEDW